MNKKNTIILIIVCSILGGGVLYQHNSKRIQNKYLSSLKAKKHFDKRNSFKEMQKWQFERLKDPTTNAIPNDIRRKELTFAKERFSSFNSLKKNNANDGWKSLGPVNQGGRAKAIRVDVSDENVILASASSGGVWRSNDKGKSWQQVSDVSVVHNAVDIVQDTRSGKTNTWYYGTGEYSDNFWPGGNGLGGLLGDGLFKSVDNGKTWSQLSSTVSNSPAKTVNAFQINWNIELNKANTEKDEIWVAALGGVFGSDDGGSSWKYSIKGVGEHYEIPNYTWVTITENGRVYAALSSGNNSGIYYSDDKTNWTKITPSFWPATVERIVMDNAKINNSIIYVLANTPEVGHPGSDGDFSSLWKYNAEDNSWQDLTTNLPDSEGDVAGYTHQGGYDMFIEVKPDDDNFVVIGGTNIYRTTDGFSSKLTSADWIGGYATSNDISTYAEHHPDQHGFSFLPSNPNVVYSAHDGGLSMSSDVTASEVTWQNLNDGFVTTQFWSISMERTLSGNELLVGGLQDNGSLLLEDESSGLMWQNVGSGDGTITAIANGGKVAFSSSQNGNIMMFNDTLYTQITPAGAEGLMFITPYILDRNNTNIMYLAAGPKVWRNSNLSEIPNENWEPTDVNWSVLSGESDNGDVSALATTEAKEHLLYIGTQFGSVYKIVNASNMDSPFTNVSGSNFPQANVANIIIDPKDEKKVIVCFSNYNVNSIFYTADGGESWSSVGGNLEENEDGSGNGPSVRDVDLVETNDGPIYFAATSIGLFSTSELDGTNTKWNLEGANSIGNTIVETMDSRQVDGKVVIGSFGKGVFTKTFLTTDIEGEISIPNSFALQQNYPNPFNPSTRIGYTLSNSGNVKLSIYNNLGELLTILVNEFQNKGSYNIEFNASNASNKFSSGVYFYQLEQNGLIETKKMLLLK